MKNKLTPFVLTISFMLVLAGCALGTQETPLLPTGGAEETPPTAALQAQRWLADQLDVDLHDVQLQNVERAEWTDSCLGLGGPAESCLQLLVPGWRVVLSANGEEYVLRTDESGTTIRMAEPGAATEAPGELIGTRWILLSFDRPIEDTEGTPVLPDTELTLAFQEENRVTGTGGCNQFGSQYRIANGQLYIEDLTTTGMACSEGVMEQEQRYYQALQNSGAYALTGDELRIWYENGQGVLRFNADKNPPPTSQENVSGLLCTLLAVAENANDGWQTCHSPQYTFEVQYPPQGTLTAHAATLARIDLPFEQGTNLAEKYLEILVSETPITCTSPLAEGYAQGVPVEPVEVNGLTFAKQSGQEVAAGNIYHWEAYSISWNQVCVSLNFVLHAYQPALKPTPPPAYDYAAETEIFEKIVATFRWLS
ncbi:MAG: META domain-containing protein [Chloroflexota bacterium]